MKMPVWFILLIILGGIISVCIDLRPKEKPVNPMQKSYDSLIEVITRQQVFVDSIRQEIKATDTIIKKEIQYVKVYAEGAYKLPADSSVKLFYQWAQLFRDSGERSRYLNTDSNGFYQ